VYLQALLADPNVRDRLKRAIADIERSATHNSDCLKRKRRCHATYNMIDGYRDLFLVKHPSRGAMVAETKKLLAYLYGHVISSGAQWASDEQLEELRLKSTTGEHREVQADDEREQQTATQMWRAFCKDVSGEAGQEARRRGLSRRSWMNIASEWWSQSALNPANTAQAATAAAPTAAGPADSAAAPAAAGPADSAPPPTAAAPDSAAAEAGAAVDAMNTTECEHARDAAPERDAVPAAAPDAMEHEPASEDFAAACAASCAPDSETGGQFWRLGGLMGVEIKNVANKKAIDAWKLNCLSVC